MKWEEYIKKIADMDKIYGEALKALTNVIVDDKQKLILAETKVRHARNIELLLITPPFDINRYFKGYDIIVTFNSDIENIDIESYWALAYVELFCLFFHIKTEGGEIDDMTINTFGSMGMDLEEVGVSISEVYQIAKELCKRLEISFDKFVQIGIGRELKNKGIDVEGILRSLNIPIVSEK